MAEKVYYEKIGRRYKPVYQYDSDLMSSLPKGSHLIVVQPGIRSVLHSVNPDFAGTLAALRLCEDACLKAMREAIEPKPDHALTAKLKKAYEVYQDIAGDEVLVLRCGSHMDVIRALQDELVRHIKDHGNA